MDDLKPDDERFPAKPPPAPPPTEVGPESEVRGGPEAPEETLEDRPERSGAASPRQAATTNP